MPSTVISSMSYNAINHTLRITFVSGKIYEYQHVPEEVYDMLRSSGSKGGYFNDHIKEQYEFLKIN